MTTKVEYEGIEYTVKDGETVDDLLNKKGFTDKEIKMAFGIANDKRYKDGNMSGAIKAIEGIKKGLLKGYQKLNLVDKHLPDISKQAKRVNGETQDQLKEDLLK